MKKILIVLVFVLLTGCSTTYNDLGEDDIVMTTTIQSTTIKLKTTKKQNTTRITKKSKKKTYKINTEEYIEYISSVMETVSNEESLLNGYKARTYSGIYIKAYMYPTKCIEENEFKAMTERVSKQIFDTLKKSNYKNGGFLTSNYEIINVEYFNCSGLYGNQLTTDEFVQFYIHDLKNYKNYNDYINRP